MTTSEPADHGYVFMVSPDIRHGVVLDRFIDVTLALGHDGPESYDNFRQVALSMLPADGSASREHSRLVLEGELPTSKTLLSNIDSLRLRALITGTDVYYVRSPEPLTPDELEDILVSMQRRGTLMDFLSRCRF